MRPASCCQRVAASSLTASSAGSRPRSLHFDALGLGHGDQRRSRSRRIWPRGWPMCRPGVTRTVWHRFGSAGRASSSPPPWSCSSDSRTTRRGPVRRSTRPRRRHDTQRVGGPPWPSHVQPADQLRHPTRQIISNCTRGIARSWRLRFPGSLARRRYDAAWANGARFGWQMVPLGAAPRSGGRPSRSQRRKYSGSGLGAAVAVNDEQAARWRGRATSRRSCGAGWPGRWCCRSRG